MANGQLGVGAPISKDVAKQFKVREDVLGSTFRNRDTLLFLDSNKPWIRMTSGVNTLSKGELKALEDSDRLVHQVGDSKLAKQGVLGPLNVKGGYSKQVYQPTKRTENVIESTEPIPLLQPQKQSTYRNTESMGFRPAPGITSASVQSKGSYGTLRESTVKFIVWSVEDLDLVEALYFRPGFTILLEWGHTLYFNNNVELEKRPPQFSNFFTSLEPTKVEEQLQKLREDSSYNYDAVFGYIKNFSWTFRQDGGYDCTVSISSVGSLIESLRVDRSPMEFLPASEFDRKGNDEFKEQQKSIFHYYVSKLSKISQFSVNERFFEFEDLKDKLPAEFLEDLQPFDTWYRTATSRVFKFDETIWYFPLYHVLDLYNKFVGKTKDGIQRIEFYTGKGESSKLFNKSTKFITSRLHFTLDPGICVLPEAPSSTILTEQQLLPPQARKQYLPSLLAFAKTKLGSYEIVALLEEAQYILRRGEPDDILNIQVSSFTLKEVADTFVNSESPTQRNSLSFIEDLLSKINDNLGGINELGLHQEEGIYYIVDRKRTPTAKQSSDYPQLILTGTKTTVTSLQVTSKISNQIGSQVAIAAQGLQGNYSSNISELLAWNKGLVDRHIKPPAPASLRSSNPFITSEQRETKEREEQEAELRKKDQEWFKELRRQHYRFYSGNYADSSFEELKPRFRDITARLAGKDTVQEDGTEKGIIPVELSFTTIGLSGLTVGQAFKLQRGALPANYTDRFGFIITGVQHEISDRWTTSIKTQFYALDPQTQTAGSSSSAATDSSAPSTATGTTAATVSCTDAVKDRLSTNFTLDKLSCNAPATKFSIPQPLSVKRHPVYGDLTGTDIRNNLQLLAVNVLETIRLIYPDMIVTSGYRNEGGISQHEAGMAADIQFKDLLKLSISEQNRLILERAAAIKLKVRQFDQLLLEYKTTGTRQPWIHITFNSGKNRQTFSTFLNDKTAPNGAGKFINPLA